MKLLLTSAGLTNKSITQALYNLTGRQTKNLKIVTIPTAHNPTFGDKRWLVKEDFLGPYQLGWKEFGIIDLAAVCSLNKNLWWQQLKAADVLLIGGGNVFYLSYWLQESGVFDVLPEWLKTKVYVGISAGSQIVTHCLNTSSEVIDKIGYLKDEEYNEYGPAGQSSAKTLSLVNFEFRPHLNSPDFPNIKENYLETVAAKLDKPMYAIDDQSALKVIDGNVEVVSEGAWRLFDHQDKGKH
jgi:dipeptidase E